MRSSHPHEHERIALDKIDRIHLDRCGSVLVVADGERPEVLHPDKRHRRSPHQFDVEVVANPPDKRFGKRGAATRDLIDVAARKGVVTRMEALGRPGQVDEVDVSWQFVVDHAQQRRFVNPGIQLQVSDLANGVHARVGPPRAIQLECLRAGRGTDGPFDLAGHGPGVLLDLPPAVARAGVFDGEFESGHVVEIIL